MSGLLWVGDIGCRDAPGGRRAIYDGPAKPFCPCDTGSPQRTALMSYAAIPHRLREDS